MKLFLLCFLIITVNDTANSQALEFTINAHIEDVPDGATVYLLHGEIPDYNRANWKITDSVQAHNGTFLFKSTVPETDYYCITLNGQSWCSVILSNGSHLRIKGKLSALLYSDISGSNENTIYKTYIREQDKIIPLMNSAVDSAENAMVRNDTLQYDYYVAVNQTMQDSIKKLQLKYINLYPTTFFSLVNMQYRYKDYPKPKFLAYYNALPQALQMNSIAQGLYFKVFEEDSVLANTKSIYDFVLYDTAAKKISINLFKGKYLLLDFWASWCKPCRENNPKLKDISKAFYENITLIGVSLDTKKEDWIRAVEKDSNGWLQASDLKGFQSIPVKHYHIDAIPRYILIDPSGNVMDPDIKIDSLYDRLKSLLP